MIQRCWAQVVQARPSIGEVAMYFQSLNMRSSPPSTGSQPTSPPTLPATTKNSAASAHEPYSVNTIPPVLPLPIPHHLRQSSRSRHGSVSSASERYLETRSAGYEASVSDDMEPHERDPHRNTIRGPPPRPIVGSLPSQNGFPSPPQLSPLPDFRPSSPAGALSPLRHEPGRRPEKAYGYPPQVYRMPMEDLSRENIRQTNDPNSHTRSSSDTKSERFQATGGVVPQRRPDFTQPSSLFQDEPERGLFGYRPADVLDSAGPGGIPSVGEVFMVNDFVPLRGTGSLPRHSLRPSPSVHKSARPRETRSPMRGGSSQLLKVSPAPTIPPPAQPSADVAKSTRSPPNQGQSKKVPYGFFNREGLPSKSAKSIQDLQPRRFLHTRARSQPGSNNQSVGSFDDDSDEVPPSRTPTTDDGESTLRPRENTLIHRSLDVQSPSGTIRTRQLPPVPPLDRRSSITEPQFSHNFSPATREDSSDDDSDEGAEGNTWKEEGQKALDRIHTGITSNATARPPVSPKRSGHSNYGVGDQPFDGKDAFMRPPPELVYDRLDECFKEHNLDQPIIEASSGGTSPTSTDLPPLPVIQSPQGDVRFRHKKSIRVVADEHKQRIRRNRDSMEINSMEMDVKHKRTKLWGSELEEVIAGTAHSMFDNMSDAPESPTTAVPKRMFCFTRTVHDRSPM
jgi:hypothetical protein